MRLMGHSSRDGEQPQQQPWKPCEETCWHVVCAAW